MDFSAGEGEVFNNLAFNHLRVADNAAQVRVPYMSRSAAHSDGSGQTAGGFSSRQNARALLQPTAVYAVSGAVQVAAGDTPGRLLHQIEGFALPQLAGGVGKTAVADPYLSAIADVDVPLGLHPAPAIRGDDVQFKIAVVEGFQRAGDKGPRRCPLILLAYQSQPEFTHASTFFAAAITASVGIKSRKRSLVLVSMSSGSGIDPKSPAQITSPCACHGRQKVSLEGPNSATSGVPSAARHMHRHGVDADKQAGMVDDGRQLAQGEQPGEGVQASSGAKLTIMVSIICFSGVRAGGQHDRVACFRKRVYQGAHPRFAPALKEPAGGWLNDDIVILKSCRAAARGWRASPARCSPSSPVRVSNIQPKRRQNRQILLHGMQLVMPLG